MSGGHFDYLQYRVEESADSLETIYKHSYSDETIKKFKIAVETMRKASLMMQRVDWLLSGDDGEESFHERWKEDMIKLTNEDKRL